MERLKVIFFNGSLSEVEFSINKFSSEHEVVDVDLNWNVDQPVAVVKYIEHDAEQVACDKKDYWSGCK